MSLRKLPIIASLAATSCLTAWAIPAHAQSVTAASSSTGEIVVTARKREETALQVPVTVTALSGTQLQNFAVNNIDSMARAVPSLIVGEGGGTIQGGIISIRGIAGADNNPLNDQAVSFNIDGVSVGRTSVRRMGDFDTAQVEVLKGPQALFFGKNSPGGIIVLKSNDPTQSFEAKISSGYEFKAKEWRTDAYVSGPLSDAIGFRLAGFFSDRKGWSRNVTPRDNSLAFVYPNKHSRASKANEFGGRATLKFDDGGAFNAKLKLAYGKVKGDSSTSNLQFVNCPLGRPQTQVGLSGSAYIDDCKADNVNQVGGFNAENLKALFPSSAKHWRQHTYHKQSQFLGGLEMNLDLSDNLTLTSQTGLYKQMLTHLGNFTQSYFNDNTTYFLNNDGDVVGPGQGAFVRRWDLPSLGQLKLDEFSQELRLASSFDGAFNFMIGGLITDTKGDNITTSAAATHGGFAPFTTGVPINKYRYTVDGKSQSIFGQLIVNPIEVIEITAGARASWEQKKLSRIEDISLALPSQLLDAGTKFNLPDLKRKASFNDVSPEFMIAYKPNADLNIYGGYKEGFLSGGFAAVVPNVGALAANQHIYKQQVTKGFEGGIKAALLDRALRVNLAYYNYKTTGLQVGLTIEGVRPVLLNAASARTEGVEFDFSYRIPIEGLSLNGALNYNNGKYLSFQAPCYGGQPSEECFLQTNEVSGVNGFFQALTGKQLVRAPEWTGNAGFNYDTAVSGSMKLGLSGNMTYSSGYFTDTANTPGGRQDSYTLFDASLRVGAEDDSWELALIGRNLTNKVYIVRSSDSPFSGSGTNGAFAANDTRRLLADTAAFPSRGRELWVRLSYRFGGK